MHHTTGIRTAVLAAALVWLAGCTGVPDGVEVVRGFELDRYLGTWYELARLDHRFERGLSNVTATYTLRDDGGVKVVNRGFDAESGKWNESVGKAYFIDRADEGRLKVSFFGPFYGAYNIFSLDPGYEHAIVAGPDRSYLWILARTPEVSADKLARLVAEAREAGFDVEGLIYVSHDSDAL